VPTLTWLTALTLRTALTWLTALTAAVRRRPRVRHHCPRPPRRRLPRLLGAGERPLPHGAEPQQALLRGAAGRRHRRGQPAGAAAGAAGAGCALEPDTPSHMHALPAPSPPDRDDIVHPHHVPARPASGRALDVPLPVVGSPCLGVCTHCDPIIAPRACPHAPPRSRRRWGSARGRRWVLLSLHPGSAPACGGHPLPRWRARRRRCRGRGAQRPTVAEASGVQGVGETSAPSAPPWVSKRQRCPAQLTAAGSTDSRRLN
jgi:hypothetical protein